jgi:soluble lytic murein transglycosylase-like protein
MLGSGARPRPWWRRALQAAVLVVTLVLVVEGIAGSAGSTGRIRIRPGDSLWALAQRYGTTVAVLRRLNHLPGDTIYAGRTLLVPDPPSTSRPAATVIVRYRVRPGDTVTAIAIRYRSRITAIVARNRLDHRATIRIGQVLAVPVPRPASHRPAAPRPRPPAAAAPVRHYPPAVTAAAARHRRMLAGRPAPSRVAVRILIRHTARALGTDPALALAVAQQESGFQQTVVSQADAIGVMQVLPSTGRWLGRYVVGRRLDLLDARDNVLAGVLLLRMLTRAAPLPQAVAGYYQGLQSVRSRGMYPDTRRYVASVLALRRYWHG